MRSRLCGGRRAARYQSGRRDVQLLRLWWNQCLDSVPRSGIARQARTLANVDAMEIFNRVVLALVVSTLLLTSAASAAPVAVRHREGHLHGFLSLRSPAGDVLASGDLIQDIHGDRVTSRLVFHFKDGSLHDETFVFSQHGQFQLISEHLLQKGPAFPRRLEMTIDCSTKHVEVRYEDEHGKEQLKNLRPEALPATLSFVAARPKPRLVKLRVTAAGTDPFTLAGSSRKAVHYVLKVDIGGLAGLFAPLIGKQPPDSHVWILEGEAPAFVRSQAPMFMDGPLWQTDLVSPVWPRE